MIYPKSVTIVEGRDRRFISYVRFDNPRLDVDISSTSRYMAHSFIDRYIGTINQREQYYA